MPRVGRVPAVGADDLPTFAAFLGHALVPQVEHTAENSQNTDKQTEHLWLTTADSRQQTKQKGKGKSES